MLTRWDPFRDILAMRRAMDRLMESTLEQSDWTKAEWSLALDVVEHDDEYVVKASLPGIKPEDLEITFDKGVLTIRGEIKDESEKEQGKYHLRERRYGTFMRTISLPTTIKSDDIEADYQDGVLVLHLPKAEDVKPRRIAVKAGEQKMIGSKN